MFNSNVNTFGNDSLPNLFVNDDSDGTRVYIENSASSSVVVLVGHSFMDGSVHDDVNNISDFVGGQGLGNVDSSVLFKAFSEFVSGSSFIAVAVSHCG